MVDMYPRGELNAADLKKSAPFDCAAWCDREPVRRWHLSQGYFSTSECRVSGLRHRLMPDAAPHSFTAQKSPLIKYQPWVHLSSGMHDATAVRHGDEALILAHFKYHAGFAEKAKTESQRAQHFNGAYEYRMYAQLIEAGEASFYDERFTVQFDPSNLLRKSP
jgi:hypothetical protein